MCYNSIKANVDTITYSHKSTERVGLRAFFVLVVTLIVVQPLANAVGNYTRYDRYEECEYNISHTLTPFLLPDWVVTTWISYHNILIVLTFFYIFVYYFFARQ